MSLPAAWDTFDALLGARPLLPRVLERPIALADLPTPVLVLDLAAFERNLARMADMATRCGIGLRPHAKMHRCPEVARRQVALGAVGICVAKLAEAEVFARAGFDSILVTSPIARADGCARVARLAGRITQMRIVLDRLDAVEPLARACAEAGAEVGVLVDLDPSMGRTGFDRDGDVVALARRIAASPGLRFDGIQQYAGQVMHVHGFEARAELSRAQWAAGLAVRDRLLDAGLAVPIVTGGGTGTWDIDSAIAGITDLQVGSYAFMDEEYAAIGARGRDRFDDFEPALFVLASAISQPRAGAITLDAGIKVLATDTVRPVLRGIEGVRYRFGGDEHGIVLLDNPSRAIGVGDRVEIVVPHCDPTVNLHDWVLPFRDGLVHELWPIAARGCSW